MTRKLLPYEHELVAQLGVTEEEYLDFLSVQIDYAISPAQRLSTPQCGPAIPAAFAAFAAGAATTAQVTLVLTTISTALTVVGILFQVAAALLAKPPSDPRRNKGGPREQRFSPRFGFNSGQELAQYGDPINLVYCNTAQNPRGSVRVGTSLVWSSVESYGSTQFMQLLLVLGAAKIKALDFDRTAFGQLPLGQFSASNTWLYYEDDGPVSFNNKVLGDGKDPTRDGANGADDVCRVMFAKERRDGYSQTFSPSSLTSIGVYDPIPLNVEVMERRSAGKPSWRDLRVIIAEGNYDTNDGAKWEVGRQFTVIFRQAEKEGGVAVEAARDMRYQLVAALDQAATYMLGTAKFKLVDIDPDSMNLDNKDISAKFECIEKGRRPSTDYTKTKSKIWTEKDREDIETGIDQLKAEANYYVIIPADDREVLNAVANNGDITLKLKKYGYKDYSFKDSKTLEWRDELDQRKNATLPNGGSIATTEQILQEFLADKPKLDTRAVKDEINDDLEKLRQVIDDIETGNFDNAQFRKAAKQAASSIRDRIRDRQKDIQNILDEIGLDKKDVKVQKTGGGNVDVLNTNTGIKKNLQRIENKNKEIEDLKEQKDDIMSDNMAVAKRAIIRFYRDTSSSFRDFNGNLYSSGGIKAMKRRLTQIKGRFTTDQIGVRTIRNYLNDLIEDKKQALNDAKIVEKDWETLAGAGDDNFFTKCFVKAESAAYQTVTACDFVKFAISCKLFRRVSGRAQDYGEKEAPEGFRLSDNGIQGRMAFFKVAYKKTESNRDNYRTLPLVFAVRRNADQDNFIGLAFKGNERAKWEFKIEPIGDISAEIQDSGQNQVAFIENAGRMETYDHVGSSFAWRGSLVPISNGRIKDALKERGPIYTNEWDLFSVRSDTQVQFSFDGGPEFRITAVTEQQAESNTGKYTGMSLMALGIYSGKGVQDLRSITAFVTEGKNSYIVNESNGDYNLGNDSTSFAPDIFADTILDRENGIGKYAKPEGIDWQGIALAKRFCKNNGLGCQLFMDGVISDLTSWRQFWAETAPFSLLEFARVGGKETLIPAIPVDSSGRANRQVVVNALFTTGNILEGSYKEEFIDYGDSTQDLIATVIYRETEDQDVFPRNASVQVHISNGQGFNEGNAIRQTFDLSQFVSQRAQAILFGKLLCNQRRYIRRGIEFKTFPTDSPISPGGYIYVDIGLNTWDRMSSGMIMNDGILNSPLNDTIANGSYDVLIYKNSERTISFDSISIVNGAAAALVPYSGYMFVLGAKGDRKRVFRTTEVQMDEEGEVTVKAMEHPCENNGSQLLSKIADFSDSLFTVR
jgi:hypothetical protein